MKRIDYLKIITEICRVILGLTFIFSGTVKAIDPVGGAFKIEDYFGAFGLSALNDISLFTSINLSALEFLLGLCILTASHRRITTFIMLVFMSFMTLLTLYLAIVNPVHDCGCFGDALILTNWQTFFKNFLVLLPASIVTYIFHKKMTPLYSHKAWWFVIVFGYLFSVGFAYYNYYNLPIVDFRPYKIGANIPQQMSIPDDAPQDEIEFIYSKDGKTKVFTMETIAEIDSTWTFVETKVVRPGYVPPITSFELYDSSGENIAETLLAEGKTVFILVSPNLDKASDSDIDEINNVYDYAVERSISFYCATNSSEESIENWVNNTGAEYPFLRCDDITLKTIIRSNPGLVLLKSGTILAKWHYKNIPSIETTNSVLDSILDNSTQNNDGEKCPRILFICSFILPLLLVWIYDLLKFKRK